MDHIHQCVITQGTLVALKSTSLANLRCHSQSLSLIIALRHFGISCWIVSRNILLFAIFAWVISFYRVSRIMSYKSFMLIWKPFSKSCPILNILVVISKILVIIAWSPSFYLIRILYHLQNWDFGAVAKWNFTLNLLINFNKKVIHASQLVDSFRVKIPYIYVMFIWLMCR